MEAAPTTEGVQVAVQTNDASGLYAVLAAYTTGDGAWHSVELSPGTGEVWQGTIPVSGDVSFFVQAVDIAGNVAVDDSYGLYYGPCAVVGDVSSEIPDVLDGNVDIYDIQAIVAHWHQQEMDPDWNPRFDLDKNKIVDIVDIMRVAARWGIVCTQDERQSS